ncbi:MAG: vWA domain-containing protein, partial [Pseudomonadota bacterium]
MHTTSFDKLISGLLAAYVARFTGHWHAAVFARCFCAIILTLSSAQAAAAAPVDVRIVVDVSKAMHVADPENLRGAGIELLVQNLSNEQSAGLWAYSQLTQKLVEYGPANGLWKQMAAIHSRHLEGQSERANLPGAVQAATWDLDRPDRPVTHLVLFSNGRIDQGLTPLEHDNVKQLLLNSWAAKLRDARVIVHTVAIAQGPQAEVDTDLLRQLADLSGGLHKTVSDQSALQTYLLDILALAEHAPQVQPDANGRFQIAPGDQALNVLWMQDEAARNGQPSPVLLQPDGERLDRLTPLDSGRWVLAQNFEMVTVREPQVGWWQVEGVTPKRLTVLGDIEIRVDGLATPVVPTEESHAVIRLFSQGQLIEDAGFLDLLDVRVWLKDERQTVPLPVDRSNEAFQAFFVNLGDGAYELEVEVAAPTFRRHKTVPFVAANPLRVDFKSTADGELVAWLQFNHADVDYGTVRAGAKVRKPPQVGVIVPAERLPAGL